MTPLVLLAGLAAVAGAGALGALVRHLVAAAGAARSPAARAVAVATCNLTGAALLAAVVGLERAGRLPTAAVLVIGTGFCGALTTFSTWVVDAVGAWDEGVRRPLVIALVDLLGQLVVGVLVAVVVLTRW
ncbi:FluC/FEX family fluoride channel [Egicoccus halophilus]|uniref:Fluoride-specific ion channel n=1 Tax=Egicoccus halophilus TaxID=1670830 RepID=A0A8J3A748_9ACTN|nr:CrcB family protein [Egicoccus halophilus]GGI02894.1 hypothetical protein GCM10011354_01910 [Egicoccus halophilus]